MPSAPPKPARRPWQKRESPSVRGYDRNWAKLSRVVAAEEPMCRECLKRGLYVPGTQTDHIIPWRERPDLKLERSNLQRLCDECHGRKTKAGR